MGAGVRLRMHYTEKTRACIVVELSHKMYFCTTYNNCFVNAVIKSIVLYKKVNFVTFWKHWRKTRKLLFLNTAFDDKTPSKHSETLATCRNGQGQRM